jgi:hypothetical protein
MRWGYSLAPLVASEIKLKPHLAEHATVEAALADAEEQLKLCREYVVIHVK